MIDKLKAMVISLLVGVVAGGLCVYLFFPQTITKTLEIKVKTPPVTVWRDNPATMTSDDLMNCVMSPIDITYAISGERADGADIKVIAADKCKTATTTWSMQYPVSQANNVVGVNAGLWYDAGLSPFMSPFYYRRVYRSIYAGGNIYFGFSKFYGASAGLILSF